MGAVKGVEFRRSEYASILGGVPRLLRRRRSLWLSWTRCARLAAGGVVSLGHLLLLLPSSLISLQSVC